MGIVSGLKGAPILAWCFLLLVYKCGAFLTPTKFGRLNSMHSLKLDRSSRLHLSGFEDFTPPCVVKVVGVGGGGGNAVMRMMETGIDGVEFCAINTDMQALSRFHGQANVLSIGKEVTRGLGAGGVPDNGRKAAEESRKDIMKIVQGCDLVFITAGMGGGTGSGAAPIVADIAREAGALTVGVVTKPFGFEGKRRMDQALQAIDNLRATVDTLLVVSNDRLLQIIPENLPLQKAFLVADDILRQGVVGISDIIIRPGLINVDFADVKAIMQRAGTALMGIGHGSGKTRAQDAAHAAISSPLLDFPIQHAMGTIFNVVGGPDMTLQEINSAAEVVSSAVDPNANVIFGARIDDNITNGEIAVTVVATGFPSSSPLQGGSSVTKSPTSSLQGAKSGMKTSGSIGGSISSSVSRDQAVNKHPSRDDSDSDSDDIPDFLRQLKRRP